MVHDSLASGSPEVPSLTSDAEKFFDSVEVDPIAITVEGKTGFTLRAYRMSDTLPDYRAANDDDGISAEPEAEEANAEPAEDDFIEENTGTPQEVPVFILRNNKVVLFEQAQDLVDFVSGDGDSYLTGIENYTDLQEGLSADNFGVAEEYRFDLSALVSDIRSGAWEAEDVIATAELARDFAYAIDLVAVHESLAPGSPLDDLDEALRKSLGGGVGAALARRKIKKASIEQTAIAWRSVIGKIAENIEWR